MTPALGASLIAHLLRDALVDADAHTLDPGRPGACLRATVYVVATPYGYELVCA